MYEFHGWITIRVNCNDDPELNLHSQREAAAIESVNQLIQIHRDDFSIFETRRSGNNLLVLVAHGLRNHRYLPVIKLFREIGQCLPESYGLLYVYDDDDTPGQENEFRVWRLARGTLEERADPFLSPYVPTIDPAPLDGE